MVTFVNKKEKSTIHHLIFIIIDTKSIWQCSGRSDTFAHSVWPFVPIQALIGDNIAINIKT